MSLKNTSWRVGGWVKSVEFFSFAAAALAHMDDTYEIGPTHWADKESGARTTWHLILQFSVGGWVRTEHIRLSRPILPSLSENTLTFASHSHIITRRPNTEPMRELVT